MGKLMMFGWGRRGLMHEHHLEGSSCNGPSIVTGAMFVRGLRRGSRRPSAPFVSTKGDAGGMRGCPGTFTPDAKRFFTKVYAEAATCASGRAKGSVTFSLDARRRRRVEQVLGPRRQARRA